MARPTCLTKRNGYRDRDGCCSVALSVIRGGRITLIQPWETLPHRLCGDNFSSRTDAGPA